LQLLCHLFFNLFIMKKLSRDEMKKVIGGQNAPGTCQALIAADSGGYFVITGISASTASGASGMVHWCCDSCGTATWAVH
jgi:hypothetical protein